jgi:hypothetical protein
MTEIFALAPSDPQIGRKGGEVEEGSAPSMIDLTFPPGSSGFVPWPQLTRRMEGTR